MSISEEILKLIENGITEWDEIYTRLINNHKKNAVSMAKNRLIQQGKIKEETINGKKILSIQHENEELISDVDAYLFEHSQEIKEYFKLILHQNPDNRTFNIKEFILSFPHLAELSDIIKNNPFEARNILTNIYKETYEELFAEETNITHIFITNLLTSKKKLSEIGANDIGKLVEFECSIVQASKNKSRTTEAEYLCFECGTKRTVKLDFWEDPEKKKVSCPNCSNQRMTIDSKSRITFQELIVQQLEVSQDGKQHTASLFLEDSEPIYSGKLRVVAVPIEKYKKGTSVADIHLYAFGYEEIDNIDINITEDDIENIYKIAKDPEVIEKLANYMLRETKGMDEVKKAIFLQQVKGVEKGDKRRNLNILLITDPGVGKSTMMHQLKKLPNTKYATMSGASGAGLIGGINKEKTEFGESWVVKPGIYALADGGTVCLDEFTHNKEVMPYVHDAMESQMAKITKMQNNLELPARCATLAACNPKLGRYDSNLSVMEQVPIKPETLSRFDLIFPLRDVPDNENDKDILKFIIRSGNEKIKGTEKKIKINGVELSDELLIKYLHYVDENFKPTISDEAEELIIDYYLKMRELSKNGAITITTRQAESLIRLSEVVAKARLKNEVDTEDAREAIELMQFCLEQISYDPETGKIDIDKVYGIPKSKREKSEQVLKIIEDENKCKDIVSEEIIFERAEKEYNITIEEVERILEVLSIRGEIYSPKFGYWRTT
ncbi:MCM family protein [Methanococcus aeolicus Nankai-3]|uniref:MCM family protein n=1 Tax=Methanococcus aeolicus (strain ATCC BAA-1280 / DSM 17508 / OCM 812 / Nankai-3) TaxID=419665 RepID=A6UWD0_META3|nr:minichromosome maintenance protein MCM [Methanococcus aeolicus]ABR56802.1 MCM family protein [Methanococcus aeolicus Nankai-3]